MSVAQQVKENGEGGKGEGERRWVTKGDG